MKLVQGVPPEHEEALLKLFCDTFPEVIVPVFGSIDRCARLLERSLVGDRVLTALLDGRLVGFAGLHYSGREWFDPSLSQLLRVTRWASLRAMILGVILFRRPKHQVLHLDTLAVHPEMRGQGIGAQLVRAVEALAQSEGKRLVTLEVEDVNPRAKRLYERMGFTQEKFERLPWPWRAAFSFSGFYRMGKDLARSESVVRWEANGN